MKVKDIHNVISSATDIRLYLAESESDALNDKSVSVYTFHYYTNLSPYYGDLDIISIYPESKDRLEVWALINR